MFDRNIRKILKKAESFLGIHEEPLGSNNVIFNAHFYGRPVSGAEYPWCMAFVWDVFRICGLSMLFFGGEKTAYCPALEEYARAHGQWIAPDGGLPGDVALYDFHGVGKAEHTGIVTGVRKDGVYETIEGNTSADSEENGGYVQAKTRSREVIRGFYRPEYDISFGRQLILTGKQIWREWGGMWKKVKKKCQWLYFHATRVLHFRRQRKRLRRQSVSILSQNCVGGIMSHVLGLPFQSPTVNMTIYGHDFVKLAKNPRHYFSQTPTPCTDGIPENVRYPVMWVDDIRIFCVHYKSFEEAAAAWVRRSQRVDYAHLYVIACSWDMKENGEDIREIAALPYPSLIYSCEDYGCPNEVVLDPGRFHKNKDGVPIPVITDYKGKSAIRIFEPLFDYVAWINRGK